MSKLDTAPYKGVRDFYPEDQFIQNYIKAVWKTTVESFGYEEYDASPLEHSEIYKEKSGEEIINEQTFTFTDRGGRDVTLRPEMTPTVARMVAGKRRELGFPLRLYSIPNLFRYEATQRGRLREHWQLNVDLFGLEGIEADLEIVKIGYQALRNFGASDADFEIRLNSQNNNEEELNKFIEKLKETGINNTVIDTTLARGQAYYTGIVFEFFDTNKENGRSILGGGRYDNLTELFGEKDLPVVGFGWGDVTTRDFLETHKLLPVYRPATELYIALVSNQYAKEAENLANNLRQEGVNVSIDYSERKVGDQIKTALKHKVPYLLVLGEDEVKSQVYKIKDLEKETEKEVRQEEIKECVK